MSYVFYNTDKVQNTEGENITKRKYFGYILFLKYSGWCFICPSQGSRSVCWRISVVPCACSFFPIVVFLVPPSFTDSSLGKLRGCSWALDCTRLPAWSAISVGVRGHSIVLNCLPGRQTPWVFVDTRLSRLYSIVCLVGKLRGCSWVFGLACAIEFNNTRCQGPQPVAR